MRHSPEDVRARLVGVLIEPRLHLVVRQERDVTRMRHGQYLPVTQQRRPRLEQSCEHVEFEVRNVIV